MCSLGQRTLERLLGLFSTTLCCGLECCFIEEGFECYFDEDSYVILLEEWMFRRCASSTLVLCNV
jgi:hypothetical protein